VQRRVTRHIDRKTFARKVDRLSPQSLAVRAAFLIDPQRAQWAKQASHQLRTGRKRGIFGEYHAVPQSGRDGLRVGRGHQHRNEPGTEQKHAT